VERNLISSGAGLAFITLTILARTYITKANGWTMDGDGEHGNRILLNAVYYLAK